MTTAQKVIKYLALAFAIFLSVSIIIGICGALFTITYFLDGNKSTEMTKRAIENNFTCISINLSAAELEIQIGENFAVETNHQYLEYEAKGDILKINETRPFFTSHSGMKVILTIPEGIVFDYADISAGAGSVTIDNLRANSLSIDLGAGEFIAKRLDAIDNAEIDGGAGSVTIADGRLNNADVEMGIGELNLTGELSGKSSIDYGIGETNLVLIGEDNDYKIELDKGLGEARLDGRVMSDDSVYGAGEKRIEIDGGVGELNITFKPKPDEGQI